MIRLVIVGEGQTEETFVRDVLAPHLVGHGVVPEPRLIATSSRSKGGALTWDRVRPFLRNTLHESPDTYVTTLFDLHGLRPGFPGIAATGSVDPLARADAIEAEFRQAVVTEAGCRPDRFVPYIQPYEFEAYVFSDPGVLGTVDSGWQAFVGQLRAARASVESPEHINDGPDTHPSARLGVLRPPYNKVLHGARITMELGLPKIRGECKHFHDWLARLESLPPLKVDDP